MAGRQAKILTEGQLHAALRAARATRYPERDRMMLLLSAKAGMRAAEIAGLTWAMVLDAGGHIGSQIALADSIAKKGSGRVIPLHPSLGQALAKLSRKTGREGHVIKSERGERLSPGSVVNWFRAFYAMLGLEGCSSHSGRRTFITLAARRVARAGGSIRDVQLLAGHRNLRHTQGYIDGDTRAQRRLVNLL
jgi:integrase